VNGTTQTFAPLATKKRPWFWGFSSVRPPGAAHFSTTDLASANYKKLVLHKQINITWVPRGFSSLIDSGSLS